MQVGIGLKSQAYTPEAYAYADYLTQKGVAVQLEHESLLDLNNDINIYFMGIRPFWEKRKGRALEVHEYQSLSTGKFPIFKDYVKRTANRKPAGRIFLNETVGENLGFSDDVPYIYRDMGVDESLFQKPDVNPEYDIVYCGSVNGRVGLVEEIERLAKIGFTLLIIGEVSAEVLGVFKKYSNVTFTGRVSRDELPGLYRKCKAGLNYTPDIYPFNIQTSTKTLEYLASGLIVISNRYEWVDNFFSRNNISFLLIDDVVNLESIRDLSNDFFVSLKGFSWVDVLESSSFFMFLEALFNGSN